MTNSTPSDLNKCLEQLKSDATTYKRLNYKTFYGFVNVVVKDYVSPSEGAFLLQCCTMLPDTNKQQKSELIDKIWNEGIVRCGQPTKEHIISLLRSYKVIGRTIEDFNEFLSKHQCNADVELYEEFLYLTCEVGQNRIVDVLADIKIRGFPITENLFNALILGHSKNGSLENCEKVLDTMASANLTPSSETYKQLIRAYIENDDTSKADNLLNEKGDSLSQEQLFEVIKTAAINDSVGLAKKALNFLPDNALLNKHVIPGLRNICIELIHMKKSEIGYSIIENLPKIRYNENEDTDSWGVFFISEMIRCNEDWSTVVAICKRLIHSDRNPRALHCCCEIMLRMNSPNAFECIKVLGETEPLRPHYFWPIFINLYKLEGEGGILKVLNEMKAMKVAIDQDTLVHYVLAKLPITMGDTKQGIQILEDKGIPIGLLLTPLLCNLLQRFKLDDALKVLKLHKSKVDIDLLLWPLIVNARNFNQNSRFATFAELVNVLDSRNQKGPCNLARQILLEIIANNAKVLDASVLVAILEQFHSSGIKISTAMCDQMIAHVQKCLSMDVRKNVVILLRKMVDKTLENSSIEPSGPIKHPRDMSLDELECQLIELKSKNLNTRGEFSTMQYFLNVIK